MNCSVDGCDKARHTGELCGMHAHRFRKYGDVNYLKRRRNGTGALRADGRALVTVAGQRKLAYTAIVEAAMGKPLRPGAIVHHVDENPSNNSPANLVVCPNAGYHALLHQRQRAQNACGNPNFRKCRYCGQYDDPAQMWVSTARAYHRSCNTSHQQTRREHSNAE